jgi:hypothetical protein
VLSLGHAESDGGSVSSRVPTQLGFRVSPIQGGEIDVQGTLYFTSASGLPFSVGAGFKYQYEGEGPASPLSAAAYLVGTYQGGTTADTMANFTGVSVGTTVQLSLGPLGLLFAPELIVSPFTVSYESSQTPAGISFWGYGRAGIMLDFGAITGGISVAVRTAPFSDGLSLDLPMAAGAELHWIIPGTQIVLSGGIAAEIDALDSFYLMGGAGLGILN